MNAQAYAGTLGTACASLGITHAELMRLAAQATGRALTMATGRALTMRYAENPDGLAMVADELPPGLGQDAAPVGVAAYASRAALVCLLVAEIVVRVGLQLLDLPGVALRR